MAEAIRKPAPEPTAEMGVHLDVTAQLLTMEPGLFSVELLAPSVALTEGGMALPSARIDPLPPQGQAQGEGRAFLAMLSDSPLLAAGMDPAFLRIAGGRAQVLLTIYKMTGAPAPQLRIKAVNAAAASAPPAALPLRRAAEASLPSLPLKLLVHVAKHGDITAGGGEWAAPADSRDDVEGFSVTPAGNLPDDALEYQAIMGRDWVSPWMAAGEFCGSRQMALSLLGVRCRLRGEAARRYRCQVWGRFDGVEHGPMESGEACQAGGAALQGLRVVILERIGDVGSVAPVRARRR